jgi:predicted porin
MKNKIILLISASIVGSSAYAQSSVTLYGVIDTGIGYQSSQTSLGSTSGGRSSVKMINGVAFGNRFGFKGSEDLGGGTRTIFQLESGFNSATGAGQYTGAQFGRQAWIGVTDPVYGTAMVGRQYTSYWMLLAPYGPTTWITGYYGAHPGDLDSLDMVYRANNSIVYVSPTYAGLTFSGSYALGGVAGNFNQGSTWSVATRYVSNIFAIAVGFQRINNGTPGGGAWGINSTTTSGGQPGVSSLNNGYQTAQAQQRLAVTSDWMFGQNWDLAFSYSNVQYIPGTGSFYTDTAIFNTGGVVLHWKATPAVDLAGGYSYTRATTANGITNAAQYQQLNLAQFYSLSKRTQLYFLESYQRANGKTLGTNGAGNIIDATASIGDGLNGTPSSSGSQIAIGMGIQHHF